MRFGKCEYNNTTQEPNVEIPSKFAARLKILSLANCVHYCNQVYSCMHEGRCCLKKGNSHTSTCEMLFFWLMI